MARSRLVAVKGLSSVWAKMSVFERSVFERSEVILFQCV